MVDDCDEEFFNFFFFFFFQKLFLLLFLIYLFVFKEFVLTLLENGRPKVPQRVIVDFATRCLGISMLSGE